MHWHVHVWKQPQKSICLPRAANPAMSAPAKGLSFGPDGRSGRV